MIAKLSVVLSLFAIAISGRIWNDTGVGSIIFEEAFRLPKYTQLPVSGYVLSRRLLAYLLHWPQCSGHEGYDFVNSTRN